ncbi:hypothetical protein QN347_19435, partial [Sphingomonas sp. 10B4]|nr:hypothetical protein [Sphingomonas sp. 10B4]
SPRSSSLHAASQDYDITPNNYESDSEAWDSAHPVVSTLANMQSKLLYPGDRDVYSTAMKYENFIANKEVRTMNSSNGHIVVRVSPGGQTYRIIITTNSDESDRMILTSGPISCA